MWERGKISRIEYKFVFGKPYFKAKLLIPNFIDQKPLYTNPIDFLMICLQRPKVQLEAVKLEFAHKKSHSQTASVRKAASDKAREDRAAAKEYTGQLLEKRRSWVQPFLEEARGGFGSTTGDKFETRLDRPATSGERGFLSPKVLFSTEDSPTPSLWSTTYEPIPSPQICLQGNPLFTPYTPPVHVAPLFNIAANPPKINSVVNLPYFQGRPGTNLDVHVRKFEIACTANSVPLDKIMEVFAARLQENMFLWFSHQTPFADWDARKDAFPWGLKTI